MIVPKYKQGFDSKLLPPFHVLNGIIFIHFMRLLCMAVKKKKFNCSFFWRLSSASPCSASPWPSAGNICLGNWTNAMRRDEKMKEWKDEWRRRPACYCDVRLYTCTRVNLGRVIRVYGDILGRDKAQLDPDNPDEDDFILGPVVCSLAKTANSLLRNSGSKLVQGDKRSARVSLGGQKGRRRKSHKYQLY